MPAVRAPVSAWITGEIRTTSILRSRSSLSIASSESKISFMAEDEGNGPAKPRNARKGWWGIGQRIRAVHELRLLCDFDGRSCDYQRSTVPGGALAHTIG